MTRFGPGFCMLLVVGCAPPAGDPTTPALPAAPAVSLGQASEPAPQLAPASAMPSHGTTAPPADGANEAETSGASELPARNQLPILLETPYRFGGRPLPEGAVAASTYDTDLAVWNRGGSSRPELSTPPDFHPATRVVLDTRVLSGKKSLGRLDADAIRAQTRAQGYWPFRLCFEAGLRTGASRSGSSVLRFSIDARGKVSYTRKMRSDLEPEVASCTRKAAYEPKYRPAPPRRVDVELTAQLSPGDVELPGRDPHSSPMTSEALRAALATLEPEVARCYGEGVDQDPLLWGRIELRLVRDDAGTVVRAVELGSRFPDSRVRECIATTLVGRELPLASEPDLVVAWRLGERSPR